MKRLTREQQKAVVQQWKRAAPALARARREELAAWQYDAATVDALLDIGARSPRKEGGYNGLVEMQKWFMRLARRQRGLPAVVREPSAAYGGPPLSIAGDATVLNRPKLALLCSVKCPGKLILDTYDLVHHLRTLGVIVISGFHSPMEKECLTLLRRSPNPVIWCLARCLLKAIPSELRAAVESGRLLLVSPFPEKVRHVTAKTAMTRNRVVAEMAAAVFVPHAAPGSKMEALCRETLASGKPLYTFDHPANAALLEAGATVVTANTDWMQILKEG